MPRIAELKTFDGTEEKLARLGLRQLWEEFTDILTRFRLELEERPHANRARLLQEKLGRRFALAPGWHRRQSGHLYWSKSLTVNGTRACLGAKIRIAERADLSRDDLMIVEVINLTEQIASGAIDVGALGVPSDNLSTYLDGRVPRFVDAIRAVERSRATDLPLIILALEHDGPGPALPKKRTRQGRAGSSDA